MPQSIDGVKTCCAACRRVAEDDADGGGEKEGDKIDLQVEIERDRDDPRKASTEGDREQDTDETADAR